MPGVAPAFDPFLSSQMKDWDVPASNKVDVILMLAADVSDSIDKDERELQRQGYADALKSKEVQAAIQSGYHGRIAVSYVEWGIDARYIVDWTLVDVRRDPESIYQFATQIEKGEDKALTDNTFMHNLMDWASVQMHKSGYEAEHHKKIIDISGDGPDLKSSVLTQSRINLLQTGVVINGLAVDMDPDNDVDILKYYKDCVMGGAMSFVIGVRKWSDFVPAVRRKIVREISSVYEPKQYASSREDASYLGINNMNDKCFGGNYLQTQLSFRALMKARSFFFFIFFFSSSLRATNFLDMEVPEDLNRVDAVLMLAVDASTSISEKERDLQREGHVRALQSFEVKQAIRGGFYGRIALSYVEWSRDIKYIVDWELIDMRGDPKSIDLFAEKIRENKDHVEGSATMIHKLMDFALYEIRRSGYKASRPSKYILDISGDGPDRKHETLRLSRENLLGIGVVINGLAVSEDPEEDTDIFQYYKDCVQGGVGSFVIGVNSWEDFAKAIQKKMVLELASDENIQLAFNFQEGVYAPTYGNEFGGSLDYMPPIPSCEVKPFVPEDYTAYD